MRVVEIVSMMIVADFATSVAEPSQVQLHFHLGPEVNNRTTEDYGDDYEMPPGRRQGSQSTGRRQQGHQSLVGISNCMLDRRNTRGRKWSRSEDFHQIRNVDSPQDCLDHCDKNNKCQYWTWHVPETRQGWGKVCILMSDISEFYENDKAISGYGKGCSESCPRYGGVYPTGDSIQPRNKDNYTESFPKVSSWTYCSYLCSNTPGCVYWLWAKEDCNGACPAEEKMCTLLKTAHFSSLGPEVQVREVGLHYLNKKKRKEKNKKKLATSIDVTQEEKFAGFIHGDNTCTGPREQPICEKVPLANNKQNGCNDRDDCPGKAECKEGVNGKECDINSFDRGCENTCESVEGARLINPRGTILHNGEKLYTEGRSYGECADLCRHTSGCEWFTLYRIQKKTSVCDDRRPLQCTVLPVPDRYNRCYLMDSRKGFTSNSKFLQFYPHVTGNRLCRNTADLPLTVPQNPKRVTGYPPRSIWPQ